MFGDVPELLQGVHFVHVGSDASVHQRKPKSSDFINVIFDTLPGSNNFPLSCTMPNNVGKNAYKRKLHIRFFTILFLAWKPKTDPEKILTALPVVWGGTASGSRSAIENCTAKSLQALQGGKSIFRYPRPMGRCDSYLFQLCSEVRPPAVGGRWLWPCGQSALFPAQRHQSMAYCLSETEKNIFMNVVM